MASEIRVNRLSNRSGLSTITFANGGVQFSGITTFANGDFRVGTGATILNPSANEMQFHTGGCRGSGELLSGQCTGEVPNYLRCIRT